MNTEKIAKELKAMGVKTDLKELYKRIEEMEHTMVIKPQDCQVKDKWLGCCYESELDSFYGKGYE